VIAIVKAEAIVIVAPALAGGLAGVGWPQKRIVLATAVILISVTAVLSLIGWIGLLYVPSLVLLIEAVIRRTSTAAGGRPGG